VRVVHVAIRFPPASGGGEQVVYNLAKHQVKSGHEVYVITTNLLKELPREVGKNLPKKEVMDGINVIRMKTYPTFIPVWGYGSVFFGLERVLKEIKPDIVHTHSYGYFHSDKVAQLRKKSQWKLVMTSHGFHPGRGVFRSVKNMYTKLIGVKTVKRIDYATALSESEKKVFEDLGTKNIQVIPNGVDMTEFKELPSGEDFRKRYNIKGKMILNVGRLEPIKGHEFLIKTFSQVVKDHPNVTLVVVGDDWGEKVELEELVKTLDLKEKVVFTGNIQFKELPEVYSASDILVMSSSHESFGIVLLEAMALRRPCIGTRVGAVPEIIEEGKTGLIVDYGNEGQLSQAILSLLADDALRKRMGEAGRERVIANFTWEKIVKDFNEVYDSLTD
jgi:glycosyltransferase involved in cell wall biosynthesis